MAKHLKYTARNTRFVFKYIKVYILDGEFYKEHIGNAKFWPKINIFEEITKTRFFASFCSKWAKNRQKC